MRVLIRNIPVRSGAARDMPKIKAVRKQDRSVARIFGLLVDSDRTRSPRSLQDFSANLAEV